jgi:hypothetical protein
MREFQIARAPTTTVVTCPASVVYAGVPLTPCTVLVTGPGLEERGTATYTANLNAGTATAMYDFPEGGNHLESSDSRTFTITRATATATAGSGSMLFAATAPALPCVVSVFPADAGAVSCTTTLPGFLTAGPNITTPAFSATPNYTITPVNGTLMVGYVQVNCFDSPLSATLPPKSAGITGGSPVSASCVLLKSTGSPIPHAAGDLEVFDIGPEGSSAPQRVMVRRDVFELSLGAYRASIDTGGLARGRYYIVNAYWDDWSSSSGYFYILP